jgi:hypothetical protein
MFVFEFTMDFDLDEQFVALSFLCDVFLGDDLASVDLFVFQVDDLEAFGKTTGAQQFTFDVLGVVVLVDDQLFLIVELVVH